MFGPSARENEQCAERDRAHAGISLRWDRAERSASAPPTVRRFRAVRQRPSSPRRVRTRHARKSSCALRPRPWREYREERAQGLADADVEYAVADPHRHQEDRATQGAAADDAE